MALRHSEDTFWSMDGEEDRERGKYWFEGKFLITKIKGTIFLSYSCTPDSPTV